MIALSFVKSGKGIVIYHDHHLLQLYYIYLLFLYKIWKELSKILKYNFVVLLFVWKECFFMKDYTLMFVIIDDLIDEVEKIEETLIINHTLK